jgi:nucleoid-associated protein YgaU
MTRENKLALVVGFGLILLVGILISDHFSAASRQEPAELTQVVDPLAPAEYQNPDLIALRAVQTRVVPHVDADDRAGDPLAGSRAADPTMRDAGPSEVEMGRPAPAPATPAPAGPTPTTRKNGSTTVDRAADGRPIIGGSAAPGSSRPSPRHHHVRSDESLSQIAVHYYGTSSLTLALAKANGISNPDHVPAGMSLRIPDRAELTGGGTGTTSSAGGSTTSGGSGHASYKVRSGDTLSKIARDLLGSAKRWNAIYEVNRDVLDSPDAVREGIVLRIPRNGR